MSDTFFFIQHHSTGSSSKGIQSGGLILTVKDLLDKEYFKNHINRGKTTLLYAKEREYLSPIKSMQLEEFEEIFKEYLNADKLNHLLGSDDTPCYFRKEIEKKYGSQYKEQSSQPKKRYTTVYSENSRVTDKSGNNRIYLGEFEHLTLECEGKKILYSGHLYAGTSVCDNQKAFESFLKEAFTHTDFWKKNVVKNRKSVEADSILPVNMPFMREEDVFCLTIGKSYMYRYERKLKVSYKKKQA